jgi:hypothetical protein
MKKIRICYLHPLALLRYLYAFDFIGEIKTFYVLNNLLYFINKLRDLN